MADRKLSTVAAYLKAGKRDDDIGVRGGRGRRGPLGAWLLRERDAIVEGRTVIPALTWREVATLAAADGIVRKSGTPYPDHEVRKAWSNLVKARLVPRGRDDAAVHGPQSPSGTTAAAQRVPDGTVPSPRGQDGIGGASGVQPLAPLPPTTAAPPGPAERVAGAAPGKPKVTATSMLPRRRFGDG